MICATAQSAPPHRAQHSSAVRLTFANLRVPKISTRPGPCILNHSRSQRPAEGFVVGPDFPPALPGILLWSPLGVFRVASGSVVPEGVTVGPDLLPGNPGTPGLEGPPTLAGFPWGDWPVVVLGCDHAGMAIATIAATAMQLATLFITSAPAFISTTGLALAVFRGDDSIKGIFDRASPEAI